MNDQVCQVTSETPATESPLSRPRRGPAQCGAGGPPVAGTGVPRAGLFALMLACLSADVGAMTPGPSRDPGGAPGNPVGAPGNPGGAAGNDGGQVALPVQVCPVLSSKPALGAQDTKASDAVPGPPVRAGLPGLVLSGSRDTAEHGPGYPGSASSGAEPAPPARGKAAAVVPGRLPDLPQEALPGALPGLPTEMPLGTPFQGRGEDTRGLQGGGEAAARIARVVKAVEMARASGPPEIRMVMEPESLGNVWLRLASAPRGLVASFRVHTEAALGVFRQGIGNLTQELARAGMPVGHMSVAMSLSWTGGDAGRSSGWNERSRAQPGTVPAVGTPGDDPAPAGTVTAHPGRATLLDTIA